jgi:uncharacterized Zn finger protein
MFHFTEADIRTGTSSQSYQRGAQYYRNGAVSNLARRGDLLTAQVEGSTYPTYQVSITLSEASGIVDAACSCPYDRGGYCKHIVAVLLAALGKTDVVVKPDLETLLASLTEKQLRRVLHGLAEGRPELVDDIEREVQWLTQEPDAAVTASPVAHDIAVDMAAIRREIRKDLRQIVLGGGVRGGYYDYWDDEAGTIYPEEVLGPYQELTEQLLDAHDPVTAANVLSAVVEEWGEGISGLDEYIYEANEDAFAETAQELSLLLVEALLSMDLTREQRNQWFARADSWEDNAIDLEIIKVALDQWWDYPSLVSAMQGNITEQGTWEGEAPYFADQLTVVRLRVLERQGRIQEYTHLAEAEGQVSLYVNMLAHSGQTERSVAEAQKLFHQPEESLALVRMLAEQGERAAALTVAAHGLGLSEHGDRRELARWTVVNAQKAGDAALALRAAQVAFLSGFDLNDYKLAEKLAAAEWPSVKVELLAQLGRSRAFGVIDVYLYEHMLVEAMAIIDRSPWSGDLHRVIEATRVDYPDWGIQHCKWHAERIMDAKKAKDYDVAVEWLRIARDICYQHNRQAEWQMYLNSLLDVHERKYKLVPMLRSIG